MNHVLNTLREEIDYVENDRLALLEQHVLDLGAKLARTQQELQTVRAKQRGRKSLLGLLVLLCAGIALLLTGTSSALSAAKGTTIKAPFKVVSSSGATILSVDTNGLIYTASTGAKVVVGTVENTAGVFVSNTGGQYVATLNDDTANGGGSLQLYPNSGSNTVGVSLRATADTGRATIYGQHAMATLGGKGTSPMELTFGTQSSNALALGMTPANLGVVTLHDGKGTTMLNLTQTTNGGSVVVNGSSGTPVAILGGSTTGMGALDILGSGGQPEAQLAAHAQGGYLALANPGGNAKVEAGVTSGDLGVVRAFGPKGFNAILGRGGS